MSEWSYRTAPLPKFPTAWEMFKERWKQRMFRIFRFMVPVTIALAAISMIGFGIYKLDQSCSCHQVKPTTAPVVEQCKK